MARAAFIMDKIMHKMGLHGKSFIPLIMGFGCNVPAIMASRTIENRKSRLVTMLINPLMSCSARLPIYLLLVGAFFPNNASLVLLIIYAIGILLAVVMARLFCRFLVKGDDTPFVMELPAYHFPAIRSWALHVWERCFAFIKKAGTVIFASTVVVWFLSNFGSYNGAFGYLPSMEGIPEEFMDYSVLAMFGNLVAWIFAPLGFSTWQATALTVSGLVAKENVVATAGSLLSVADAGEPEPVDRVCGYVPDHGRLRRLWCLQPAVRSVLCRYRHHP